ncbi:hypothetical protein [Microbacterium sp. MRS-1]|nr:hypothetical protein [Microbacterium sp. MRS-1]EXJ52851.1 hypothetical protein AS96_02920 [Microbacterium sp. MRS-1]
MTAVDHGNAPSRTAVPAAIAAPPTTIPDAIHAAEGPAYTATA